MRFLKPVLSSMVLLLACSVAHSDPASPPQDGLALQASPLLAETIAPAQRQDGAVFLRGETLIGRPDLDSVLQGQAELRKAGTVLRADRLEYDQANDLARASGQVRINRSGNVYEGPLLELQVERFEGFFEQPSYQFLQNNAHGKADRAVFLDEGHTVVTNATYTTCKRLPGPDWMPDWILRASTIRLDSDEDVGVANGGVLSFLGVPVLPVLPISFPLSERRKSGFLPPTLSLDSVNGSQLTVPYYWNIAPNRDATITPTVMTSRGLDTGVEFRYLEPGYLGTVRANYMGADRLRGTDRWGLAAVHNGTLRTGLAGIGNVAVALSLNRVSDDDYWRDFAPASATLTQRLLQNSASANWASGNVLSSVQVIQWQTLQDANAPIVPPYDRLPQITARYGQSNARGLDWSLEGDFTQFQADRNRTGQPNSQRGFAWLQLSRPFVAPAGYLTPKLQLHASTYQFDTPLPDGQRAASSTVPTFSLDGGLVFERETSLWGTPMLQTLEPRAFYVYTPYRDQRLLPNYDTAPNDFNFASIYTENNFVGHDKISDNDLLTLGVTTRFLDVGSGAQIARLGLAQRVRFEDQQVTLNSSTPAAVGGLSDVLLGASVNLNERWVMDSTVQYNVKTDQSERSTLGARYSPGEYRVLNAAYRFQKDLSELAETSWQWPLNNALRPAPNTDSEPGGRYYSVGRISYSLSERRLLEMIVGVEYDAGCWLSRVVMQKTQTSANTSTQSVMFQLEFVGFTRLSLGPQRTLSSYIPRYQNLRQPSTDISRFSNYD